MTRDQTERKWDCTSFYCEGVAGLTRSKCALIWGKAPPALGKRLPFADADWSIERDVRASSSFQSFLLGGRGNPGALRAVASCAGGDKILQASRPALGPGIEMVAVLSGPGTATPEPRLHLAEAIRTRHTLAALLTSEPPHRVPASNVLGVDDHRNDYQDDGNRGRECYRRQNTMEHSAQNRGGGRAALASRYVSLRHERQDK